MSFHHHQPRLEQTSSSVLWRLPVCAVVGRGTSEDLGFFAGFAASRLARGASDQEGKS